MSALYAVVPFPSGYACLSLLGTGIVIYVVCETDKPMSGVRGTPEYSFSSASVNVMADSAFTDENESAVNVCMVHPMRVSVHGPVSAYAAAMPVELQRRNNAITIRMSAQISYDEGSSSCE